MHTFIVKRWDVFDNFGSLCLTTGHQWPFGTSCCSLVFVTISSDSMSSCVFVWSWSILVILFRLFGFVAPSTFKIISLSNLSILCVTDEGYYRSASCALYLIFTLLLQYWPIKNEILQQMRWFQFSHYELSIYM